MAKSKARKQQIEQKLQQQCIFCKGYGMSNQHIWPQWIKHSGLYPDSHTINENIQVLTKQYSALNINTSAHAKSMGQNAINRKGNIFSRKMRMVCRICNNEWMSKIEDASKDIILALRAHNPIQLSVESQGKLAAWIALMTIIAEFTDIPTKAISHQEREYFFANKTPPLHWQIWIGKYQGQEWNLRYRHHGYRVPDFNDPATYTMFPDPANMKANWQATTFVVGELLVHAISSTSEDTKHDVFEFSNLAKIWPATEQVIDWSSLPIQNDTATEEGSNYAVYTVRENVHSIFRMAAQQMHNKSSSQ